MAKSFFEYFKENMDSLGLPAPNSLFATQAAATSTASAILNAIKTLGGIGSRVTIGELIVAGTKLEALSIIAGMSASFYVGAVIGSIAVAAGNSLSDIIFSSNTQSSMSTSQVISFASRHNLNDPILEQVLKTHPEIINTNAMNRRKASSRLA